LVQATPPEQVVPHEPQLRLSVCVSTHAVVLLPNVVELHAVPPSPQTIPLSVPPSEPPHVPPEQVWLLLQAFPHLPQLLLSVCVLVQVDPHCVSPAPQAHMPPLHVPPCAHWFPQLPQLKASVCKSTHELLQLVSVAPEELVVQLAEQVPPLHAGVPPSAWQTLPQRPQLFVSFSTEVHALLQIISPAGQLQRPFWQVVLLPQLVPQEPQFALSVVRSTQALPHETRPCGQTQSPLEQI
jgi:hypothetical protein